MTESLYIAECFYFYLLYLMLPASLLIEIVMYCTNRVRKTTWLAISSVTLIILTLFWVLSNIIWHYLSIRLALFFLPHGVYAYPVPMKETGDLYRFITEGKLITRDNIIIMVGLILFFLNRRVLLWQETHKSAIKKVQQ